jgi:large conductance mechanosensitive channel
MVIKAINRLKKEEVAVTTKDCPHCLTAIPIGAQRCAACCVDLPAAA